MVHRVKNKVVQRARFRVPFSVHRSFVCTV